MQDPASRSEARPGSDQDVAPTVPEETKPSYIQRKQKNTSVLLDQQDDRRKTQMNKSLFHDILHLEKNGRRCCQRRTPSAKPKLLRVNELINVSTRAEPTHGFWINRF